MMVAGTAAVAFVAAGLALLVYSLVGGGSPASASPPEDPAPHRSFVGVVQETFDPSPDVPKSKTLKLTVPEMKRVENVPVHDAPASDDATLDKGALHVKGTGFPWQEEANVYIAGHRLGYKNTQSYLLFYDLDELKNGDEIILTDADGTRYTYEVFKKFVVDPDAIEVMRPLPGKNIVSLQTCTLPDYTRRMIVQAELKSVE